MSLLGSQEREHEYDIRRCFIGTHDGLYLKSIFRRLAKARRALRIAPRPPGPGRHPKSKRERDMRTTKRDDIITTLRYSGECRGELG